MSETIKGKVQEFRPKPATLKRLIKQLPAEDIKGMAEDTIKDDLGLGTTPENKAGRDKQVRDAQKTIKDVERKSHEPKK